MKSNSSTALRGTRIAGFGAAAALTIGLLSNSVAAADTFVPLPDGSKDAPGAVITRTDESALISPSLASNGAAGSPGTNNSSTHGVSRINTGYIVGCQVDITGLSGSFGGGISLDGPSMSGSLTVPISAGQVKFVNVVGKDLKKNGKYSVQYQDTQLEIQNCGGFAQARSYTVVEIVGDNYSKTTLYGQPFSIG